MSATPEMTRPLELHSGDRMSREEFHRIYSAMPEDFKAELIGGIVYVASPLKIPHGTNHLPLGSLFFLYECSTPGTQAGDNTTVILGDEGEPQPDLLLRILPEYGGQSGTTEDEYIDGAPELIAEIAHSSRAIDLHSKRDEYRNHGVREYLVLSLREDRLYWFDLTADEQREPDDGVIRVATFPGLWIHVEALLARDAGRLMDTLNAGLASPGHAEFVADLARRRA